MFIGSGGGDKLDKKGLGWVGTILIFIVGSLILVLVLNPEVREWFEGLGPGSGGPPDINLSELAETYNTSYISQYLWNNYANEEIKLSDAHLCAGFGTGNCFFSAYIEGVDYCFTATTGLGYCDESAVYLIDPENVVEEAKQVYASPKFTIIGTVTKKEINFGYSYSPDYENAVVIQAIDIEVHPS